MIAPISRQPTADLDNVFKDRPKSVFGCPQGLEILTMENAFIVEQRSDYLDILTPFKVRNKYDVMNWDKENMFTLAEETTPMELLQRVCCQPCRGFAIHVYDFQKEEVGRITREFKSCSGCSVCADREGCVLELTIEAPVGEVIGHVIQQKSTCVPYLNVYDADWDHRFIVGGPSCSCQDPCCMEDVEYPFNSPEGLFTGIKIAKVWSGAGREYCSNTDKFCVYYPADLDVYMKFTTLGVAIMLDFMFFESVCGHS